MRYLHFLAIGALFLTSCETQLRDGISIYADGNLGKHGMSGLISFRKEIPGGQESWYFIPWANWENREAGLMQGHVVSNGFP